jgi:hypothetical protein
MAGDELAVPERTETGVEIEDRDPAGVAEVRLHDRAQRPLRPHWREATEEDPARVAILADAHRGLQPVEAVGARVLQELGRGPGLRGLVPLRRHQCLGELVVPGVLRHTADEVDAVAIEIDVVLVHAPDPREAVRVDGVHQDDAEAGREIHAVTEPRALAQRTRESLDTVGPRDDQQPVGGIGRSEHRDVGGEDAAVGARVRMRVAQDPGAGGMRRVEERGTRGLVIGRQSHDVTASPAAVTAYHTPPMLLPFVSPGDASPVKPYSRWSL